MERYQDVRVFVKAFQWFPGMETTEFNLSWLVSTDRHFGFVRNQETGDAEQAYVETYRLRKSLRNNDEESIYPGDWVIDYGFEFGRESDEDFQRRYALAPEQVAT